MSTTNAELGSTRPTRLGSLNWRHPMPRQIAVSATGRVIASAGKYSVRLIDTCSGATVADFPVSRGADAVCFSPDDLKLLFGCGDGTVKIADLNTGTVESEMRCPTHPDGYAHLSAVTCIRFVSHDSVITASGWDDTICMWRWPGGQFISATCAPGYCKGFDVAPRSRRIVTVGNKGATIWTISDDGKLTADLTVGDDSAPFEAESVVWCTKETEIAVGMKDGRIVIHGANGVYRRTIDPGHDGEIYGLLALSGEQRLISSGEDGEIVECDLYTGVEVRRFRGHTGRVWSLASADGSRFASSGWDGTVRVWERANRVTPRKVVEQSFVNGVTFVGNLLVCTGSEEGGIRIWDVVSGECVRVLEVGGSPISALTGSSQSKTVVTGNKDGLIRVWDSESFVERLQLRGTHGMISALHVCETSNIIAAACDEGVLELWNSVTGEAMGDIHVNDMGLKAVCGVSIGARVAVGGWGDHTVKVLDLTSGEIVRELSLDEDETVKCLAVSPDGTLLAAASGRFLGGFVDVWRLNDWHHLVHLRHELEIECVCFFNDGRTLGFAGHDRLLHIVSASDGRELAALSGHADVIGAIAFSNRGDRLVTGSLDSTALVWDVCALVQRL